MLRHSRGKLGIVKPCTILDAMPITFAQRWPNLWRLDPHLVSCSDKDIPKLFEIKLLKLNIWTKRTCGKQLHMTPISKVFLVLAESHLRNDDTSKLRICFCVEGELLRILACINSRGSASLADWFQRRMFEDLVWFEWWYLMKILMAGRQWGLCTHKKVSGIALAQGELLVYICSVFVPVGCWEKLNFSKI